MIHINSIDIQGFKTIKELKLDFTKKVVLIIGKNGSGKSALMEAITFILTNYLSENMSDYINWYVNQFRIYTEFTHDETTYTYEIIVKRKGSSRLLLQVGTPNEWTDSDAVLKIEEMVDPTLTRYANLSGQHTGTEILFEKPAPRLAKLKTILGMDRVVETVVLMKADLSEGQVNSKELIAILDTLKSFSLDKYEIPETPNITEAENRLAELKEKELAALIIMDEISELDREALTHKNDLTNYQVYFSQSTDKKQKISDIQLELDNFSIGRKVVCTESSTSLSTTQDSLNDIKLDIKEVISEIALVEAGKCGSCGQAYHGDVSTLKEHHAKLLVDEATLLTEIEHIRKELQDFSDYQLKLVEKRKDKEIIETRLQIAKDDSASLVQPKNVDEIDFETKFKEKRDALTVIGWNESVKQTMIGFQNEIAVYGQKLEEIERIVAMNETVDKKIAKNKQDIEDSQILFDKAETDIKNLKDSIAILDKDFSAYLIDKGTMYIQDKMNELFQKAYGRYQVKLEQTKKSVDFYYTENGEIYSPVGVASGFEKQSLALSFKGALAQLNDVGILGLDEVDSDADEISTTLNEDNSIKLYETILSLNFGQVFAVTHRSKTQEYLLNEHDAQLIEM